MAHELVAPVDHDNGDKYIPEVMWLLRLFSRSNGIAFDLPQEAFSATNSYSSNRLPKFAPINKHDVYAAKQDFWAGLKGSHNAVTVDLMTSYLVTGVVTQGNTHGSQWVTNYSVQTSDDGHIWVSQGAFVGNFDGQRLCKVRFSKPVLARFVKFTVVNYHGHPSMKVDVLVYKMS